MCFLSEMRVADNELSLRGRLKLPCCRGLRLATADDVRRYAIDYAKLSLPEHEHGEGRCDVDIGDAYDVRVALTMMMLGADIEASPFRLTWGGELQGLFAAGAFRMVDERQATVMAAPLAGLTTKGTPDHHGGSGSGVQAST